MLSALALAVIGQSITLAPTDDVWIYAHAQDQASDEFLRAWGSDNIAVEVPSTGGSGASWSMMKFDLASIRKGELKSAKLVLTSAGELAFLKSDSEKNPLQVRPCPTKFEEENFSFGLAADILPSREDKSIFATAILNPPLDQKDFAVEIDLLTGKGDFKTAFKTATETPNKLLGLAITTTLDPQVAGDGGIYKFYSRNTQDKTKHPKLIIEIKE